MSNLPTPPALTKPGLFITGTDTGVGKTYVTAGLFKVLHRDDHRVGVCKPVATGCDEQGVSEDEDFHRHVMRGMAGAWADTGFACPINYTQPVSPAVAAEAEGGSVDFGLIGEAFVALDEACDLMLVEGVGGLLVPLGEDVTVLDLISWLDYPAVVVARPDLGTLNHTAMTVRLLRDAGVRVAGVVVNAMPTGSLADEANDDPSRRTNCQWIERMNDVPIIAVTPTVPDPTRPMSDAFLASLRPTAWRALAAPPR